MILSIDAFDFNNLIGSLTGGNAAISRSSPGGFNFRGLLKSATETVMEMPGNSICGILSAR